MGADISVQYVKTPNGVGNSVRMDKVAGVPELFWGNSLVDSNHSAPQYYMVYLSGSPSGGFGMWESTQYTRIAPDGGAEPLVFYKLAAGNAAGNSDDEPPP